MTTDEEAAQARRAISSAVLAALGRNPDDHTAALVEAVAALRDRDDLGWILGVALWDTVGDAIARVAATLRC